MVPLRRAAVPLMLLGLTACGTDATTVDESVPPPPHNGSTKTLADGDCSATPAAGRIVRSGYGLNYSRGTMTVSVKRPGSQRCVAFAKSGRTDPAVPPDTLLFTFTGDRGEGGQLEFLAVDLAGGILPWLAGASAREPGAPITATVGVSLDGTYFTSATCTLRLATVTETRAAGRFDCPDALAARANPFDPDDDVSYDDPTVPAAPPESAALSGLFTVEK